MNRVSPLSNENGFGIVSFLTLMPFLISIMTLIAGAAFLFKADAHLKHECRMSVLKSQHEVAEKLEKLLSLNSQASELRLELEDAKLELKEAIASGIPMAIGAARLYLASVEVRQGLLAFKQKSLIVGATMTSLKSPMAAREAVLSAIRDESLANSRIFPSASFGFPRPPLFKVDAKPEKSLTPDYTPSKNFSKSQTVDVDVKVAVIDLLPSWLKRFLPMDGLEMDSHCQATLIQDKDTEKWVETLKAVK